MVKPCIYLGTKQNNQYWVFGLITLQLAQYPVTEGLASLTTEYPQPLQQHPFFLSVLRERNLQIHGAILSHCSTAFHFGSTNSLQQHKMTAVDVMKTQLAPAW